MGGSRGRGRPQKRWRDEMKDLLMGRGLCEKDGMMLATVGMFGLGRYVGQSRWKV